MPIEMANLNAAPSARPGNRRPGTAAGKKGFTVDRGNLLLIALFAAGIGCVYVLYLRSGPEEASAEIQRAEQQVQAAITMLGDPKAFLKDNARDVVKAFDIEAKQRQVPLSRLAGNPFVYVKPQPVVPNVPPETQADPEPNGEQPINGLEDALRLLGNLKLQSILKGPQGTAAMISNNVLTAGQTINGWTIVEIKAHEVVLKWNDRTHALIMEH